ncbi:MAG: autotransporter assembly complex protein TamA, partial [Thiothrix sp.]
MASYTKQLLYAWCLLGVTTPVGAFWQETDNAAPIADSPVKVQVQGADSVLAANLKAFLPSLRNLDCSSSPERLARFIDSATIKLQEGAEAVGYYDARFDLTPARQGNCLVLNIAIQAGEPVRVTRVAMQITGEGAALPEFQALAATPPYQRGDILVHQRYEDFKSSLNRAANNLGFFDAKYVTREIRVNPETHQAEVALHFDTGKRYRLGKVQVEQDVLAEKYVQRYVRVKEGDAYQADNLLEQQRILEGSGYYSEVIVSGRYQQAANGIVPVAIQAQRRKRYSYKGSVGYGSDTGIRVGTEAEAHWVSRKG